MTKRRAITVPPKEVLTAFGTCSSPERLPGGQGQAFRAGDLILKPAKDDEQTNWLAGLLEILRCEGFRLPKPVCSRDGQYVVDGWQAWERIEGEHRSADWEDVVQLCIDFHEQIADVVRPAWLDRVPLDNQWTIADKVTWNELKAEHHPTCAPLIARLRRCLKWIDPQSQLIHGDFGGNVLYADGLPPAVIDFSPYWRPAGFAVGVVVADAIVWEGADISLIEVASMQVDNFDQLLARAELRRIVEIDVAHRLWSWDVLGELDAHLPLVRAIADRCS